MQTRCFAFGAQNQWARHAVDVDKAGDSRLDIRLDERGTKMFGRRGGLTTGPVLVLRKFGVNASAPDGVFVEIIGRASGLMGWFLTTIGFDPETSLKVSNNRLSFSSSSLFGQIHQVVPLSGISSTHCGYSKPIGYLILAAAVVLGGILNQNGRVFLISLLVGGFFLVRYWLSKNITISIETRGGMTMGLTFKRSVIENVPVDIQKSIEAIEVVNQKVIESQHRQP